MKKLTKYSQVKYGKYSERRRAKNQGYKTGFLIMVFLFFFVAFPGWSFEQKAKAEAMTNDYKQQIQTKNSLLEIANSKIIGLEKELKIAQLALGEKKALEEKQTNGLQTSTQKPLVTRSFPGKDAIVAFITSVFGSHTQEALAVASCENSSLDMSHVNRNTNGTFDIGPFQINSIHSARFGTKFMEDIYENIQVAHTIYLEQGWGPWYSSRKCHGLN